jgi:hypothetical protein
MTDDQRRAAAMGPFALFVPAQGMSRSMVIGDIIVMTAPFAWGLGRMLGVW